MAKARLKRGIELVRLANRIEALKMQEDEEEDVPGAADMPAQAREAAGRALADASPTASPGKALSTDAADKNPTKKHSLSKSARSAIFREVVLAKVREKRELEERERVERTATTYDRHDSSGG